MSASDGSGKKKHKHQRNCVCSTCLPFPKGYMENLKDEKDSSASETAKLCFGCGEPMFEMPRQTMKPPMLVCQNEINCAFSAIEILPRCYDDAQRIMEGK